MKFLTGIILFLFAVWILPLGAFIKPENQKKACNGRRLVCLCAHPQAETKPASPGWSQTAPSGVHEESAGAFSHHFLHAVAMISLCRGGFNDLRYSFLYEMRLVRILDPVPKFS